MAELTPGTKRSAVILKMKAAIASGVSASSFLTKMKAEGLGYRRTTFLDDWRSVGSIEAKTGLLKYVRKDYVPSPKLYAESRWNLSREFFYKVKVTTRLRPGEPLQTRWINIVGDKPMTPREWEESIIEKWAGKYRGIKEMIVKIEPELALRRVQ